MAFLDSSRQSGRHGAQFGQASRSSAYSRLLEAELRTASKRKPGPVPLSQKAFKNAENDNTHAMVWKLSHTGPLTDILKAKPDFSVLIVNEYPATRSLIRSVLSSFGVVNLQEASGGGEALLNLRKRVPDLAIVDHDMAHMGGLEFMRRVRHDLNSPAPFLPIVMTTSAPNTHQVHEIRNAGVTEILAKPFAPNALARQIVSIVQNERNFIQAAAFSGPDRRRRQLPFTGNERRYFIDAGFENTTRTDDENIFWI